MILGTLVRFGPLVAAPQSLPQQNETLFQQLQSVDALSDDQMKAIRKIFADSGHIGQGNPSVTRHPVTPEACQAKLKQMGVNYEDPTV